MLRRDKQLPRAQKLVKSLFIKGANITLNNKKSLKKLTSNQHIINKKINQSLRNTYKSKINTLRKKRNLTQFSYFCRFFLTNRNLNRFFLTKNFDLAEEAQLLMSLKKRFKKFEIKNKMNMTRKQKYYFKPLSKRQFSLGTLYLTYTRRNLFANLSWSNTSAKASCGERYRGPKKKTMQAREEVMQKMAQVLGQSKVSTLDIHITPFGRVYKHLCRMFFRLSDIYVRYIIAPRKRSHGFTRPKKIRRT